MHSSRWAGGASLAILAWATAAHADPLPISAEHVVTPGRSIVTEDTGEALVLNPANLAFLPAPELRWTWVHCPDSAQKVGCGMAWEGAANLPFGLATGLRFELVEPPWGGPQDVGVGFPFRGYDYFWTTWGVAIKLGEHAAFGASLEGASSQNPYVGGLFGVSAGLSWRPNPHFAFSAVARDFNRPSPGLVPGTTGAACNPPNFPCNAAVLDGRYALGFVFRPTGRRELEIGFETQYWEGEHGTDQWTDRGTVTFDTPWPPLGRVFTSVEVAHLPNDSRRGVVGTAGLELHYEGVSAGGGALFGNGLGSRSTAGEYANIAIAGFTQTGLPHPQKAVWIRLENTPSSRDHVALLRHLWSLADAHDVSAVTLVVRTEPAAAFAHAEELADAIRFLRAHHKKVLCSLEDGGPKAIYVCANADRVVVSPAGGLRYAGLKAQYMYLKGLLDKLGVKAEFIRIGPHKTAPEEFTNEHAGPVAAADHMDLLAQQESVFNRNLSLYRHMTVERVAEETKKGPFVAQEAKQAGFVDAFAFDDELGDVTKELVGRDVSYVEYAEPTRMPEVFGARKKIAILYLEGDIIDGRSRHIPILDERLVGSYSFAETVKHLREDHGIGAVVLRIESPGGSSLASDVMWRELRLLGEAKPLIVSMGTVAASGGYYVASASRDIFALPLTVTGSIGVFYGKADLSGLLGKIGVNIDTYKTAPRADAESMYRGFTPDEEQELQRKVGQFYDTFLDRVSTGRGMKKEDIDAVGRGRVWTGQQALERHLVDHLGGMREALEAARRAAKLPEDAPIIEEPQEPHSLLETALGLVGVSKEQTAATVVEALPPAVRGLAHALAPVVVFGSDIPMARLEWVDPGEWVTKE